MYHKHVSDLLLHAFINPYLFSLNKIQLSLTPEYPRKFTSLKIFFPLFFRLFLSQTGNDCSSFPSVISFSRLVTDHVLEGRVISTVHVTSDQECQMKCILSEMCDSFNLGPQTASRLYPCEILDQRSSRKVIKREQWKFRAGWVSGQFFADIELSRCNWLINNCNIFFYLQCRTSPCLNGGTCFLVNGRPLCVCAKFWEGATCNVPQHSKFLQIFCQ